MDSNKSGLFVGVNKGFVITKPKVNTRKLKPSARQGKLCKRVKLVREVIREVAGFAPYERKMMELIRTGDAQKEKKAVRIARHRLGTQRRALQKKSEMDTIVVAQKSKKLAPFSLKILLNILTIN